MPKDKLMLPHRIRNCAWISGSWCGLQPKSVCAVCVYGGDSIPKYFLTFKSMIPDGDGGGRLN